MGEPTTLKDVSEHFAFGENWASYAKLIDEDRVRSAEEAMARLLGDGVRGRTFLDIGCGSGLHALAAIRLGAKRVFATDLDPNSVATTKRTLTERAPGANWECREVSVFSLDPATHGQFDVVYSWGVLHHTGAMYEAIAKAAAMVAPGGTLCIALYGKTRWCEMWKVEKRFYAKAPRFVQFLMRKMFNVAKRLSYALAGKSYSELLATYKNNRGMNYEHDVHDWMGGFPYESISPAEAHEFLGRHGFTLVREFVTPYGMLGSGCDEFVFRKLPSSDGRR
jgi:SAM-dependent methyltransferase